LGLICGAAAFLTVVCDLLTIALTVPEDIAIPLFIYSFLAFPVLAAAGFLLSLIGYLSNRRPVNLAGMGLGGLALVGLIILFLPRGCAAKTVPVAGVVERVDTESIVVDGQTVVIPADFLPLPSGVVPGAQVEVQARTVRGRLSACGVAVYGPDERPTTSP
jgi:hypothetical protein